MSVDANYFIPITTRQAPTGLSTANFSKAVYFATEDELPSGFETDTIRVYTSASDLALDFDSSTETYIAGSKWLGGTPAINSLTVYFADSDDNWTERLNKARNKMWWFWSFFPKTTYANNDIVLEIASWSETNSTAFPNMQTGTNAGLIRDVNDTTNIARQLTTLGYRFTGTITHATDPYAGIGLIKHFARVNYSNANSTITGEYKKSSSVAAEDLTGSENSAMTNKLTKSSFYSLVESQGSVDVGRWINTYTHSTYGEYWDDVVNLAAFENAITVARYNAVANSTSKIKQDPAGQATIDAACRSICELYISNGYLGPRNYIDPDTGEDAFTLGYEILTVPEDILDLTDTERSERYAATLRIRIFRAGAIHKAPVTIDVY